jgi:hypothetical protein
MRSEKRLAERGSSACGGRPCGGGTIDLSSRARRVMLWDDEEMYVQVHGSARLIDEASTAS